jgi:hypothetical protein
MNNLLYYIIRQRLNLTLRKLIKKTAFRRPG